MFAFVCATASAQVTLEEPSGENATLTQQEATITILGANGVVIESLSTDGVLSKVTLAGPQVRVVSRPGEGFAINDKNSPSVGGVVDVDGITFFGDLTLSSSKWDEQAPNHFQVHVYDALVELRTVQVSEADLVDQVPQRPKRSLDREVPLNQQGDFIRHMKELAKKRRNS
jgi:hypothetical protein